MYNANALNTAQYNAYQQLFNVAALQDDIVFNGFSLQTSDVITSKVSYDEMPSRSVKTFDIPRDHGRGIVTDFYRVKRISLEGTVTATTAALLNTKIDEMKKLLAKREGNLDIKVSGDIRRFIATATSEVIFNREHYHVTFVNFKVSFDVYTPFGADVDFTSLSLLAQTQLSLVQQIDNTGTTYAKPVIHMLLSTVSAITQISIENTTTSEKIVIAQSFANNDVLIVNSDTKEVTLNGSAVDYTGVFFNLDIGTNSIQITLTGTSATYNLETKYKRAYL